MKKILFIPFFVLLTACNESKPTAIEVSDLGKVGLQCFVKRTHTMDEALNPLAGLSSIGGMMEEMTKAPIKHGWEITSEDRTTATLNTKRDGVSYVCEYQKLNNKWTLVRSMWDGEEAYSQKAEEEIKKAAQLKQDTTWEEREWANASHKYYALPPQGADSVWGKQKQLAINCDPNDRGVMLNGFIPYGDGKNIEFDFDGKIMSFGVSGGGSNSYLGELEDSGYGTRIINQSDVADKFIEALKAAQTVKVMEETFIIDKSELQKVPCI